MKVKEILKNNKIKSKDLAHKLDMSQCSLSLYINSHVKVPHVVKLAIEYITEKRICIEDWETKT